MIDQFIQFVRDLYQTNDFVPLHEPKFEGNEKKYVLDTIDSTFVSSVGKYVDQFEIEFAKYVGAKYAVATVNGTAALHVALKLVGVVQGDEVITQPLTFVATCNAIHYCGASPTFVDIDEHTLGLSSVKLKLFLESHCLVRDNTCYNKSTGKIIRACVPMHTFGHPVEIDTIQILCQQYHIALIEDAAESLGSFYKEQHTGTFGDLGVFSFNGNKVITTGGGGMIVTNNEAFAKRAKHLTTTAKLPHQWDYIHNEVGYNYRMPNINAALGLAQLENLPNLLKRKRKVSMRYKAFFEKYNDITYLIEPNGARANYWLNTILCKDEAMKMLFLKETNAAGVMTRPAWKMMNELDMFNAVVNCEIAKNITSRLINIPSTPR